MSYVFNSRPYAPGNVKRVDSIAGSDGGVHRFIYDAFSRDVIRFWPRPRDGSDQLK